MSLNAEELFSERALGFRPSEIRELLKLVDSPEIISLAGGMPDDRFFPIDRVIEASTFALKEYGKKALQYGSTEGIKKLRVLLMDRMEKEGVRGIDLDNVIISTASQQGLSLVAQVFVNPGDTVIVEEPSYLGAIQAFGSMQAKFCTVAVGQGWHADGHSRGQAQGAAEGDISARSSSIRCPTSTTLPASP